ncbi:hypothetical protein [Bacillus phage vB_BanS-Thrax3]|nr:hypothetical protein [Bacillus phage vB_BanS-Thrax3]
MSALKMLEHLAWGRIGDMEFFDVGNLYKNVLLSQVNLGSFINGEKIKLTHTFLNSEWSFVEKHKTFMEAYKESEAKHERLACLHGKNPIIVYTETGMESVMLQQFLNISFQDLIEDKYWAGFADVERFPVTIVDQTELITGFPFVTALEKLLLSDSHYMVQYHTGKKIYVDEEGIKDAETEQLVVVDAGLHQGGHWYVGDKIGNDGSMTILDALTYIDWNNQVLIFGEGTEDEFVIETKAIYEDIDLRDVLPEHAQDVNVKQLFTQPLWTVKNKTL